MAWQMARRRSDWAGGAPARLARVCPGVSQAWLRLDTMFQHFFGKYRPEKRYMRGPGADQG